MLFNPLTPDQDRAVRRELAGGHLIQAIVLYRGFTGSGLADAKAAVEAIRDGQAGQPADDGTTGHGTAGGNVGPAGGPAAGDWRAEAERLVFAGQKIQAVKLIRESTNLGLAEALRVADAIQAGSAEPFPPAAISPETALPPAAGPATRGVFDPAPGPAPAGGAAGGTVFDDARGGIEQLVVAGRKIEAIKAFRAATGLGLKESKDAVEAIEARLRESQPNRFQAADLQKSGGCLGVVLLGLLLGVLTVGAAVVAA